jgi:hypothetical protein
LSATGQCTSGTALVSGQRESNAVERSGPIYSVVLGCRVAYEEFVKPTSPEPASRSDLLDLLALSISLDAAIYVAGEGDQARRLTREELAAGRFAAGGLRFEFSDRRPALHDLRVNIGELPEAMRTVVIKTKHSK